MTKEQQIKEVLKQYYRGFISAETALKSIKSILYKRWYCYGYEKSYKKQLSEACWNEKRVSKN